MTLVAGSNTRREAGFSLVEMLTVLFILTLLIGLAAVSMGKMRSRSQIAATEGQVHRLGLYLESYQKIAHRFPPDGIDSVVETESGTVLQSGAAMTYALARPTPRYNVTAGGKLERIGVGEPIGEFSTGELYVDDVDEDAVELVDAWHNPFHYDRLAKGGESYSPQGSGEFHLEEPAMHEEDPRENPAAVTATGPQNPKGYDIWSHGPGGHGENSAPEGCVATWSKPTQ